MDKSESRWSESSRKFQCEDAGEYLASFFNADVGELPAVRSKRGRQGRKRAIQLVRVLQLLSDKTKEPMGDTRFLAPADRLLARYVVRPVLCFIDPGGKFDFGFDQHSRARFNPIEEWQAIQAIMELGEHGLLGNLKECAQCHRWMFARFSHQRFCSEGCRQAHFRSSEEFKAGRRAYMRRLYHLKKKGFVK